MLHALRRERRCFSTTRVSGALANVSRRSSCENPFDRAAMHMAEPEVAGLGCGRKAERQQPRGADPGVNKSSRQ